MKELLSKSRGVKLIFSRGHTSLTIAFEGPNAILVLHKADVAPVENGFDTPALKERIEAA